jgi:hypothetical protein
VEHGAAVAECPAFAAGGLLADETIFNPQPVVRERLLVKQVAELIAKVLIFVVAHLEQAVFDPEGIAKVVPQLVIANLRRPALEILAVEELDPVAAFCVIGASNVRSTCK